MPPARQNALLETVEHAWGRAPVVSVINPKADEAMQESWARQVRLAASPATARAVFRMLLQLDIRTVLPSIRTPTLVLWTDSPFVSAEQSRYLAEHIPGARLAELRGSVAHPTIGDMDTVADPVEEFVSGALARVDVDRVLTTVLFTDIVGSTQRAAALGDRRWKELISTHDRLAEKQITRHQGRLVDRTGDGLLATFDGPARGIRCAQAVRNEVLASPGSRCISPPECRR